MECDHDDNAVKPNNKPQPAAVFHCGLFFLKKVEKNHTAGLTQAGMSEALSIPKRTIEDWEAGRRTCPDWVEKLLVAELIRIANLRE